MCIKIMETRQKVKKTILLCGEGDGDSFRRRFTVGKVIAENQTAVCYKAGYKNSSEGVLMEYYPQDGTVLLERRNGQLTCAVDSKDNRELFGELKKEYIQPYLMIRETLKKKKNSELAAFVPPFEIYYGCNRRSKPDGSVYIWRPMPEAEAFAEFCCDLHKRPEKDSAQKVAAALKAITSLTKCISALHSCGMLHRSISPYSFGFMRRGKETLVKAIQMLDLSTVCPAKNAGNNSVGEEGFFDPDTKDKKASVGSDIYSIGAMMFYAVIASEEAGANIYKPEYFDRLGDMLKDSKLLASADISPKLRFMLADILGKCLCAAPDRYADCSELLTDLENACGCIKKSAEGENKSHEDSNPITMMQYQLYEYPLYKYLSEGESEINVLVVGFENYGQKFLDCVLQAGQMYGKTLNVNVICSDEIEKRVYLNERPALKYFCYIDGILTEKCDNADKEHKLGKSDRSSCGNIFFSVNIPDIGTVKKKAAFAEELFFEKYECEEKKLHYVFVDIDDSNTNRSTAEQFGKHLKKKGNEAVISYASKVSAPAAKASSELCPVYVNADVKKHRCYPDIMRMAFNTHLLWEKDLNCDYNVIKKNFADRYNCNSSIASVLSVKYKLHTIGIELDEPDFANAAAEYDKIRAVLSDVNDPEYAKYSKLRDNLICDEHNRWAAEKICLGWQQFDSISECAYGRTKDEKRKRHICICMSRPGQPLKKVKKEDWFKGKVELDDLDKVSVELARTYRDTAEAVRNRELLHSGFAESIERLIFGNVRAAYAFDEWLTCISEIWNKDADSIKNYKNLKNAFLNTLEELPEEKASEVRMQISSFEKEFYPVMASQEYRDWKDSDAAIVDNISFLLTYSQDICMVIPFFSKDEGLINNVAAATAVSPSSIVYLYQLEDMESIEKLKEAIPYVTSYMNRKNFRAEVEFYLFCSQDISGKIIEELNREITALSKGRIARVTAAAYDSDENIAQLLTEKLLEKRRDFRLLAAEKNKTGLSKLLSGSRFYEGNGSQSDPAIPYYKYDHKRSRFSETAGCELLKYISKTPYLTVTDMASLGLAVRCSSSQPNLANPINTFWKLYCGDAPNDGIDDRFGKRTWKNLCGCLGKYVENNDCLFNVARDFAVESPNQLTYRLPAVCLSSLQKIIEALNRTGLLRKNFDNRVKIESGCCKVEIKPDYGSAADYNKLFTRINALLHPEFIRIDVAEYEGRSRVKIYYDDLTVSGLDFADEDRRDVEKYKKLLTAFSKRNYILNYNYSQQSNTCSFTYASRQIKELLTIEGKILEMYVYYAVKKSGLFDDVVTGIEFDWNNSGVRNEFDCMLTKGFQTILMECKARRNVGSEPYYKLDSAAKDFGINVVPVMITDTNENSDSTLANNATQRERGAIKNITTIWEQSDIENIAQILLDILNGRYNNSNSQG